MYKITKTFPKDELFGITNQLRRAAVSIAANIVEGQARSSKKEFLQFLSIANASLVEVEYYLELIRDLEYIDNESYNRFEEKRTIVGNLLHGLMKSIHRTV